MNRDAQVDTCGRGCGDGCPSCGKSFSINFKPRDIRGDFFGIPDPKLEGEGGTEETNDSDSY